MKIRNLKCEGFTLIELLIVLVILAILVMVAYPSYRDSVLQSRRTDGHALLLKVAQAQERHFTQFGRYANALTGTLSATNLGWDAGSNISQEGFYTVTMSNLAVSTFTLTVTPANGDYQCGNLTLTHEGARGYGSSGTSELCW